MAAPAGRRADGGLLMRKRSILPVDVRIVSTPDPIVSASDLQAYLGASYVSDAAQDALLAVHLAAASALLQGPRSATGVCFTDHALEADYASGVLDLFLPGGRVKAGTSVTGEWEASGSVAAARVLAVDGAYYLRPAAPVDEAATLRWTASWGRVPGEVREATLRLAAWLQRNPSEDYPEEDEFARVVGKLADYGQRTMTPWRAMTP